MAIIYLPRQNFELDKNPHYLVPLHNAGISNEDYNLKIKPFLETLPGFYITKGAKSLNSFKPIYCVHGISFEEVLNYVSYNSYLLRIPILDRNSYNLKYASLNRNSNRTRISTNPSDVNLSLNTKKSQNGIIQISRLGMKEKRIVTLEDIVTENKVGFTPRGPNSTEMQRIFDRH